jgi:hypothetical protein
MNERGNSSFDTKISDYGDNCQRALYDRQIEFVAHSTFCGFTEQIFSSTIIHSLT